MTTAPYAFTPREIGEIQGKIVVALISMRALSQVYPQINHSALSVIEKLEAAEAILTAGVERYETEPQSPPDSFDRQYSAFKQIKEA